MAERTGKRKTREQVSNRRPPKLGYYLILTDTRETEQNYMIGLRNSIPKEFQEMIVINVYKTKTAKLVNDALKMISLHPQYCEPWIIFDRDQVVNFNNIIASAERKGINVGWSNPCIEVWFNAYFGAMPVSKDSVSCNHNFEDAYLNAAGRRYDKSDVEIYSKLCGFGNECNAIGLAERKLLEHTQNGKLHPESMSPATTVHILINEIKGKLV